MKQVIVLAFLLFSLPLWACEMTMGYRTNAKPPLIAKAPDNTGLYQELFQIALSKMDCNLKVVRQPKARILQGIKRGTIDFYPGLNFSESRAQDIHYLPNGLLDGFIGLTRKNEPDIHSLKDVADRQMVMMVSLGSYDHNADKYGIMVRNPPDFGLKKIVELIVRRNADFHVYNLLAVQYFLQTSPDIAAQLKVHLDCCDKIGSMYMGFSKRSDFISFTLNPEYQVAKPISESNTKYIADKASLANRLSEILIEMQSTGEIRRLYQKYFNGWGGSLQSAN